MSVQGNKSFSGSINLQRIWQKTYMNVICSAPVTFIHTMKFLCSSQQQYIWHFKLLWIIFSNYILMVLVCQGGGSSAVSRRNCAPQAGKEGQKLWLTAVNILLAQLLFNATVDQCLGKEPLRFELVYALSTCSPQSLCQSNWYMYYKGPHVDFWR